MRALIVGIFTALGIVAFIVIGAIPQDLSYHRYADQRIFWFIPNFFDVVSNLPFLIVGIIGASYCLKNKQQLAPYSWVVFFCGIILVFFGSVYYHWTPNSYTLVWDRIPMTIGFMGLFIGILSEAVHHNIERRYLAFAVFTGIASVLYWRVTDDLRFYGLIQFGPLISIPIIFIFFQPKYSHRHYLFFGLVGYGIAKLCEMYDKEIFQLSQGIISGHSLKHLSAAVSVFWVYRMLRIRQTIIIPNSSQE